MRTRTKASAKASAEEVESAKPVVQKTQLAPEAPNPPQLFILPKEISNEARIVALQNPKYSTDSRYVICPIRGFYEFTKVAAAKSTPRSWLLSSQDSGLKSEKEKESVESQTEEEDISKGYIMKNSNLYIATSVDPLFFVIPVLSPQILKASESSKTFFLSGEDYIDQLGKTSIEFKQMLRQDAVRTFLEKRMAAICDTVEAGDETMYRINDEKLLKELLNKADRMVKAGLPISMEEKLIRKALEVPMLSIKRDESFMHELRLKEEEEAAAESGISTPATESNDSQTTASTTGTSFSEASTAATSFSTEAAVQEKAELPKPEISAPEGVVDLLRLRTAFSFICSNYLPAHITAKLKAILCSETSPTDFTPLETHLAHLAKLRQDALAARQLGDMSRKRMLEDDEDESKAEKKRKKDEEEKRKKAGESRGVKNLKKVNTAGMKKMSDFFKKKA